MNYSYVSLCRNRLRFSRLAAKHLESTVSLFENENIVLVVNDLKGCYPIYWGTDSNTFAINSQKLVNYLICKFGKAGYLCAEYRPVTGFSGSIPPLVVSEEPLDNIPLNKKDFTLIDFIPLSRHSCVTVVKNAINVNSNGAILPFGPVDIFSKSDVFAIVPDSHSFVNLIHSDNNDGVIYSTALQKRLAETSSLFPWVWENSGIFYFTANRKSYRTVFSTREFASLSCKRERLPNESSLAIHKNHRNLSIAQKDAKNIGNSQYYSVFESGKFTALVPDLNGPCQRFYSCKPYGYHFSGRGLCVYLLEKYHGIEMFHLRVSQDRLVFSPENIEEIPEWNTFHKVPILNKMNKIHFYRTPEQRKLVLPYCLCNYLTRSSPKRINFYRCDHLWAIVRDKDGTYQLQKTNRTIYCADTIPQIQESLQCEDEDYFWTKFDNGVLLFSNRRLNDETFDPKIFEKIE